MRALALLSGGLDSMLAARLIQEQGIEVVGLAFTSPFFGPENARRAARQLGIPLIEVDITEELIPIILKPRYGYGKQMNPCIDCHTLMVKKAREMMGELGASFIVTGEVLGERPKSQNATALHIVARDSGADGYLLRPLSAKLLPPTVPEEKGWVDRERLMDIQGRSRKAQMALAEEFGLKEYPTPAGGCLLTDPGLSARLKELLSKVPVPEARDLQLLKYGRHFWVGDVLVVVARRKDENEPLVGLARPGDYLLQLKGIPGPRTLVHGTQGGVGEEALRRAAALTARYSKAREKERVAVLARRVGGEETREFSLRRDEVEELAGGMKDPA
ncbi:DUF814 domain-containing protein [Desulfovirgula thermocuniculi]|uniref:DUF814 domain-containing protein n=1 Tax=Desulfovirgula thermocuniculi TaxID=348842 RepID=UPI0004076BC2|nr:DUF814 domain-containing protein [Desulfovirgula thermocuniculi]